ncbi:FkbM family methyltransferase [Synechocystis sp. PCC 7338]|uniref:FkbM family methyltransferase n=1 Tax=Synechocystis sp. PCC 7338 TaxID=2732530 RepID=UPI001BAF52E3|nr:FkbM family methyltransferase [Synechocystis sp. PCC 7338]QUS59313.1 FkbM family methyltransferase [Synechocystis sp. PCC 7338]
MKNLLAKTILKILKTTTTYDPEIALTSALGRCVSRKTKINTVIDIGASNGCWSATAKKYFSTAFYHLIEANPCHAQSLENLKTKWKNYDYTLAAAGDTVGEIYFNGSDPFGGLASHTQSDDTNLKVPVVTIDSIVEKHRLNPPYLLKLDTHGFEVPIFEGAEKTLENTSLIIVETYNFDINPQSLRFPQMCQFLEKKGFRCIDICDPLFRNQDKALWQFDLFFIPTSSQYFQDNSWH